MDISLCIASVITGTKLLSVLTCSLPAERGRQFLHECHSSGRLLVSVSNLDQARESVLSKSFKADVELVARFCYWYEIASHFYILRSSFKHL